MISPTERKNEFNIASYAILIKPLGGIISVENVTTFHSHKDYANMQCTLPVLKERLLNSISGYKSFRLQAWVRGDYSEFNKWNSRVTFTESLYNQTQ